MKLKSVRETIYDYPLSLCIAKYKNRDQKSPYYDRGFSGRRITYILYNCIWNEVQSYIKETIK